LEQEPEHSSCFLADRVHVMRSELEAVRSALSSARGRTDKWKRAETKTVAELHGQVEEAKIAETETVDELRRLLEEAKAELDKEDIEFDPTMPLKGRLVSQKVRGTVPDNIRDLAVDLGVRQGYPGHTVFEAIAMVNEAQGAQVVDRVKDSGQMFLHCLMERAIMLEDDQAKRIGEERLPVDENGNRTELKVHDGEQRFDESRPWEEGEAAKTQEAAETAYEADVMGKIDCWVNKLEYKPKDCPAPGSVAVEGGVASAADILCLGTVLACAFLWAGVDGTTHGRCVR
jgi:hypothetical protein